MRTYIERQGKVGQRKMARVRNRFGGDNCGHDADARRIRQAAMARDERRIFSRERDLDLTVREDICPTTGVTIPAGGGKVRLDDCDSGRRPTLYFAPQGNLVAAHF